jgi:hypothetical protein
MEGPVGVYDYNLNLPVRDIQSEHYACQLFLSRAAISATVQAPHVHVHSGPLVSFASDQVSCLRRDLYTQYYYYFYPRNPVYASRFDPSVLGLVSHYTDKLAALAALHCFSFHCFVPEQWWKVVSCFGG